MVWNILSLRCPLDSSWRCQELGEGGLEIEIWKLSV